jgi:hypothetical protein
MTNQSMMLVRQSKIPRGYPVNIQGVKTMQPLNEWPDIQGCFLLFLAAWPVISTKLLPGNSNGLRVNLKCLYP